MEKENKDEKKEEIIIQKLFIIKKPIKDKFNRIDTIYSSIVNKNYFFVSKS